MAVVSPCAAINPSQRFMATPITGPIYETESYLGSPISTGFRPTTSWMERSRYRQVRPYNLNLSYAYFKARASYSSNSDSFYKHYYQVEAYGKCASTNWSSHYIASAYNNAYARFQAKITGDRAQLGSALAEWRKTAAMVNNRSLQLFQFVRAVKRGRFGEANKLLKIRRGFRPKAKDLAGMVLEYSFGWAPTVMDIHSGMKVLTGGIPPSWVKTSAKNAFTYQLTSGTSPFRYSETNSGAIKVSVGAVVYLTNPNLWLAEQLGLVNPAGVLWEITPFSFLVDYFVNVGDVLNSWTDTLGISLGNAYRTWGLECTSGGYQEGGYFPPGPPKYGALNLNQFTGHAYRVVRDSGSLPGPTLQFTPPRVSLRRATTSIALLIQLLKG